MIENENAGLNGATATPNGENQQPETTNVETKPTQENTNNNNINNVNHTEITFTQSQINEMITDRIGRFYKRYNVENKSQLDELVARGQGYDVAIELNDRLTNENAELNKKILLLTNKIDPARYDDVINLFKGAGIDLTQENLTLQLATHPEWLIKQTPLTTITAVGNDRTGEYVESEEEKQNRIFGV